MDVKTVGNMLAVWMLVSTLETAWGLGAAPQDHGRDAFARRPVAERVDEGVAIRFELATATDVEVTVLDAKGRPVRHLAAGALGADRPPPAPLASGLEQTLIWDGLSDDGQPAGGEPFLVRVRSGLRPVFDRFIGAEPANQGNPVGLGHDAEGRLYVMTSWVAPNAHYPGIEIKRFDREGRYVNQIMPYPASLPPERVTGLDHIETKDGIRVPVVQHGNNHSLYPQFGARRRHRILSRPDGRMAVINAPMGDGPYGFSNPDRRLLVLGGDGSVGEDYFGPRMVRADWEGGSYIMPALSPDGETIYAAGYRRRGLPVPVVTRTTWDAEGEPEIFLGDPEEEGAGPAGLIEPRGLAVDRDGFLYVCDNAAGRVAVFTPAGEPAGAMAVEHPDMVAVHRKTGAVYVLTVQPHAQNNRHASRWTRRDNWSQGQRLLKFDSREATEPSIVHDLPSRPGNLLFSLDDARPEAALWLAGDWSLQKIVDKGDRFEFVGNPIADRIERGAMRVGYLQITADPHTEEVWVGRYGGAHSWRGKPSAHRYDGRTGEYLGRLQFQSDVTRPRWGEIEFCADGETILFQQTHGSIPHLYRYDREGRPAPWPGQEEREVEPHEVPDELFQGFMHPRGLHGAPDGHYYVLHHTRFRNLWDGRVSRIGADGSVDRPHIVKTAVPVGGVRVGRSGHVYVGVHLKRAGQLLPDWFEIYPRGHLLSRPEAPAGWGQAPGQIPPEVASWYVEQYGAVVRFKPEGGELAYEEGGAYFAPKVGGERDGWSPNWRDAEGSIGAEGVDWMWHGLAPIPSRRGTSRQLGGPRCSCQTARFGLDDHERLLVPDVFRFDVAILDAAGNLITRFGEYGNQDDPAGDTVVPLAWPHAVTTTREAVYVADMVNHRVVRVRLDAADEALAELPLP